MGLKTIGEIIGRYWVTTIAHIPIPEALKYWGFWSRHIFHIRYEPEATEPYVLLKKLLGDKEHFIITTNGDHQTQKAFGKENVLATQGDYEFFQTVTGAGDKLWHSEQSVRNMMANMQGEFEIREEHLPFSEEYNERLMPNLRCDDNFVEKPWLAKYDDYKDFVVRYQNENIVFLEIGVGFNTPSIMRWPFERMTKQYDNAKMIRMNLNEPELPPAFEDNGIELGGDITENLRLLCE